MSSGYIEMELPDPAVAAFLMRALRRLPDGFSVMPVAPDALALWDPDGVHHVLSGDAAQMTATVDRLVSARTGESFSLDAPPPPPSVELIALIDTIRTRLPAGFRIDVSDEEPDCVRIEDPDGHWAVVGGALSSVVSSVEDEVSTTLTEPFSLGLDVADD